MAITKSKPSYKTINRFRVNPKVDALLESLFYSQCVKQNLIDDKAIFIDGTKLKQMPIDIHLYGKEYSKP